MSLNVPRKKTKVVATIGPASSSPETLRAMIRAGMNVARLNFSHGTHESHTEVLKNVRKAAEDESQPISVFQDLCGPKVRISPVTDDTIILPESGSIKLSYAKSDAIGDLSQIFVEAFDPAEVIKPGERALLADGRVVLRAEKVSGGDVHCSIVAGGPLRSRSGIAVPESKLDLDPLTEKDLKDLEWGVENKVDYVALSFVQSDDNVEQLRDQLRKRGLKTPIIAKIERARALDDISEIAEAADVLMVARGDLGLELPLEKVPSAQSLVISTANFRGTPVITATQMLQSMVNEIRPTRAEVSDVATAVKDGTDAVMLSEETAIGKYPVKAVEVLSKICMETEANMALSDHSPAFKSTDTRVVPDAICYAACGAADKVSAQAILAGTQSGNTARLLSKYRPQQALFAATSEQDVVNRMALYWGVEPFQVVLDENTPEEEAEKMLKGIRDRYGYKPGSRVVITAGRRAKETGSTSLLEVREIPRS